MMLPAYLRLRRINLTTAVSLLAQLSVITLVIWAVVVATHSDDHLPELFRKLTPAGNCLCETSTTFDCKWTQDHHKNNKAPDSKTTSTTEADWQFQYGRDDRDFGMSEYKCNAAFPGLFEEVHRAVAWRLEQERNVTLGELDSIKIERGRVRVLIADGHIRILEASHSYDDQRKRALAILYSLHRAISADPKAIPNVEFILSADDMVDTPSQPIWAITRRNQDQNLWVMPDFGFWSWDIEDIGSMDELAAQVIRDEEGKTWDHKIPQLVWRGTTTMLPKLRHALLDASKGKSWNNVAALTPAAHPENYVSAAEQCRFMYLAHAEGRSYSGSLKYRQLCRSVIVIHKLQWIQHYHYLLISNGTEQNYVEVERDFSDLDEKMEYLMSHPDEARRIADNNVKTFRERYFTPASGACYWRALIHGWAASSFKPRVLVRTPDDVLQPRGMRFENFVLMNSKDQTQFKWDQKRL